MPTLGPESRGRICSFADASKALSQPFDKPIGHRCPFGIGWLAGLSAIAGLPCQVVATVRLASLGAILFSAGRRRRPCLSSVRIRSAAAGSSLEGSLFSCVRLVHLHGAVVSRRICTLPMCTSVSCITFYRLGAKTTGLAFSPSTVAAGSLVRALFANICTCLNLHPKSPSNAVKARSLISSHNRSSLAETLAHSLLPSSSFSHPAPYRQLRLPPAASDHIW